jgi:hypothetical protein
MSRGLGSRTSARPQMAKTLILTRLILAATSAASLLSIPVHKMRGQITTRLSFTFTKMTITDHEVFEVRYIWLLPNNRKAALFSTLCTHVHLHQWLAFSLSCVFIIICLAFYRKVLVYEAFLQSRLGGEWRWGVTRAYDSMGWMSQCYSDEVGCPLILDIGRLCLDSGKSL